jgi:hypothetical protein
MFISGYVHIIIYALLGIVKGYSRRFTGFCLEKVRLYNPPLIHQGCMIRIAGKTITLRRYDGRNNDLGAAFEQDLQGA